MFDIGKLGESIINSGINSLFSMFGAKKQNKWNRENMAISQGYTQDNMRLSNDIWKEQNAIQMQNQIDLTRMNPILQKQGMMQAGMNPNGQMSGNVAAAPTGASAPSASGPSPLSASNPFSNFLDVMMNMQQMRLTEKQADKAEAEADKTQAESIVEWLHTQYAGQEFAAGIDVAKADAALKQVQYIATEHNITLTDAEVQERTANAALLDANAERVKSLTPQEIRKALADAGISEQVLSKMAIENEYLPDLYASQVYANNMSGDAAKATAEKAKEEAKLAKAQAAVAPLIGEYYRACANAQNSDADYKKALTIKQDIENNFLEFYYESEKERLKYRNHGASLINDLIHSDHAGNQAAGWFLYGLDYTLNKVGGPLVGAAAGYVLGKGKSAPAAAATPPSPGGAGGAMGTAPTGYVPYIVDPTINNGRGAAPVPSLGTIRGKQVPNF